MVQGGALDNELSFFSIVNKDCARDELMVRARRPGDIEKLFPDAKVTEFTASDYHYRAAVKIEKIGTALVAELGRVTYSNFKDSVTDRPLHDAYLRVWTAMASIQPKRPYAGVSLRSSFDFGEHLGPIVAKVRTRKPKKLTKGQ